MSRRRFQGLLVRPLGFTLLEVLVALGIVAVVAVLSWRGLDQVLRGVRSVAHQDQALQQAMAVFTQLQADLNSLHPLLAPSQQPAQASPSVPWAATAVLLSEQGLVLEGVEHGPAWLPQPPQAKRIAWRWTPEGLQRQAQALQTTAVETTAAATTAADQALPAPQPVPMGSVVGVQMRLLYSGGRWGPAQVFGSHRPLPEIDLVLQGPALGTAPDGALAPTVAPTLVPTVVALEVALSMAAQQTWVQVLPLGAALVAGQKAKP